MKNIWIAATLLLLSSVVKSQSPTTPVITYTPMTAAGYQFKYIKSDSGFNLPNRDTSYGRGTRRGGSLVFDSTNRLFYGWDGIRWSALGTATSGLFVDSVTVAGNNICQWRQGVPTCYTLNGSSVFIGIDSVTYQGNSICQWKNGIPTCYAVIPGVDSVVITGNQMCQWKNGVPICYTINGNVLGTGIDSVTVVGTQLCQWTGGTPTCYTINNTSSGIDSLTVTDSLLCSWSQGVSMCFNIWHQDTIYVADDLYVVWDSSGHQVIHRLHDDGRVWGGIVTGGTACMDIDVTPTFYYLGGRSYLSAQTTITIAASDPTLNRYDLAVADSFGLVTVIQGTAAVNPVIPQHNPASQVPLTSIYVPAGATCLPISKGMIYNENIEYTTGSTGTVTVNYNNTDNPHALTKAAFVSEYDFGATLTFTKPSGQDTIRAGAILKFWIYLNKPFTGSLQVQFYNGATPTSSRQVVGTTDGFNALDTLSYQNVSMIVGNWQTPPTIWNKLIIYPSGQDLSGAGGFYLDEIQVQTGLSPQGKSYVDSVYRIGDSIYYTKSGVQIFISGVSSGGGSGVQSVTGDLVDNTDPLNPIVNTPSLQQVTDVGFITTRPIISRDQISAQGDGTAPLQVSVATPTANLIMDLPIGQRPALVFGEPGGVGSSRLKADSTDGKTWQLPDTSGVLVTSVNGNFADKKGNVTVSGGGSGTVTTVTGTAPIVITSTPTTTPNVTITQATTSTNGYLSSTHWNLFNNKVDSVTKNSTYDSIYTWRNGTHTTIRDSIGGAAIPTWNQTLVRSPYTKQKAIWDDSTSVDSSGITFMEFRPRNYGRVYSGGTGEAFRMGYGYYPGVNGADPRPNVVGLLWGYNGGLGYRITAGEPTWGVRTETYYNITPSAHSSEFHGVLPEFLSLDGVSRRLGSAYTNNNTGYTTYNMQIDALNVFQGATDTAMLGVTPTQAGIGFNTNGLFSIQNKRVPANGYNMTLSNQGVIFATGGTNTADAYFNFGSPATFTTHATIGANQGAAARAFVAAAGLSGFTVEPTGLSGSADWKGYSGTANTSGTFQAFGGGNVGSGIIKGILATSGGNAQYVLYDNNSGFNWGMFFKGGTVEKSLYFGTSATDSSFKIRGDNGNAYFKYNLGIGTAAPTASLHVTRAGTTSLAPFKLNTTSAALLTTPEAGAIEVLADSLYYTGSSAVRYKVYPQAGSSLPSQTGNSGKFLTTDGATASWGSVGAGSGAVLQDGTTPLTNNWDMGAFTPSYTKTGATANTVYDAFKATNTTTASSGNQMYGGYYHSIGQGWKTTATAASQSVDARWGTVPVQGAAAPTGNFNIDFSIAGGAFVNALTINSGGALSLQGALTTTAVASTGQVAGTSLFATTANGTTITDGIVARSTTAATGGVPVQYSPAYRMAGQAWTGAASQLSEFRFFTKPVNGTTPITSSLVFQAQINSGGYSDVFSISDLGKIIHPATNTTVGTTGAQTINKPSGTVNLAAAGTSLVVTNSLVTTSSIVFCVIRTNDANATSIKSVVPAAGSFTINVNNAPAAEISIGFFVIN